MELLNDQILVTTRNKQEQKYMQVVITRELTKYRKYMTQGDWQPAQCEFCYKIRFPFLEELEKLLDQRRQKDIEKIEGRLDKLSGKPTLESVSLQAMLIEAGVSPDESVVIGKKLLGLIRSELEDVLNTLKDK